MKKRLKFLATFCTCFVLGCSCAFAADVTGYVPHKMIIKMENSLYSNNPPEHIVAIANDDYNIKGVKPIEKGTQIYMDVVKVSKEKRGKLDASVTAVITKVYVPSKDLTVKANNKNAIVKISKYEKIDKVEKAADAGISIANHFVSNITYPAHFVKGAVKNEEGNRLKSGAKEMYDSSVFSYVGSGKPLELDTGSLATLTFYTKDVDVNDVTKVQGSEQTTCETTQEVEQ